MKVIKGFINYRHKEGEALCGNIKPFQLSVSRGGSQYGMGKDKIEKFEYENFVVDDNFLRSRILNVVRSFGWQHIIAFLLKKQVPFEQLKTIEIGCGTGTLSLTLNLLGAETALLDADESALKTARKVFSVYGRTASYIKANVIDPPPEELMHKFDIVISGGLVEHFSRQDRERVVLYHKLLMKSDGFVYIGVPNRLSLFYQAVAMLTRIMGQWTLDIEIPFTPFELKKIAKRVGFSKNLVIGNFSLVDDFPVYSAALGALILKPFPKVRRILKRIFYTSKRDDRITGSQEDGIEIQEFIKDKVQYVNKKYTRIDFRRTLKDYLSAGIILFGFGDGMNI